MTKDTDMTDKSELLAIASYMTDAECAQAYRELKAKADKAGFAIVGEWIDALAAQPRDDVRECSGEMTLAFEQAGWLAVAQIAEDRGDHKTAEDARQSASRIDTALATTTQPDTDSGLVGELSRMADGLRGSMWANRDEIISLLDKASTALRNQPRDDVIEQCAKVADNYARTQREAGAMGSFEAADIADHIVEVIRARKGGGA